MDDCLDHKYLYLCHCVEPLSLRCGACLVSAPLAIQDRSRLRSEFRELTGQHSFLLQEELLVCGHLGQLGFSSG